MSDLMQYSEEWKKEMKKLPKDTIIEIAAQIGKEKQAEINNLKLLNIELLNGLLGNLKFLEWIEEQRFSMWSDKTQLLYGIISKTKELITKASKP